MKAGKYKWIDRGIFSRTVKPSPQNRRGIVYGISYQYHGKRRLEVVGQSIAVARQALSVRKAEIAQGKYNLESTRKTPRFPAFVEQYLEDYSRPNKRSYRRDEQSSRHLLAFFGDRRLSEITSWEIERYRSKRSGDGAAVATVNLELALLKHLLGFAIRRNYLHKNPAKDVKLGRVVEKPFRILSRDEEALLLQHCATDFWPLLVFALNTGLRRGELHRLEWRDVDLGRKQVTVRQSKSGRVRTVPLNMDAVDALRKIPGRDGLVFAYGGVDASKVNRHLAGCVRLAGIPPLRFHDLRHTFASRLVMAGVDLPTVQELLGHSSILMTRKYSHPTPQHRREAVQLLTRPPRNRNSVSFLEPE